MKRFLLLVLALAVFSLSFAALAEVETPYLDSGLYATAKQALRMFENGDFEGASALLGFAGADELQRFVSGNFATLGAGVQTTVSVAYWTGSAWNIAVPLYEPSDGSVEVFVLTTGDGGTSFSGYRYATWSAVEVEYGCSDYVEWNEEYLGSSLRLIAD